MTWLVTIGGKLNVDGSDWWKGKDRFGSCVDHAESEVGLNVIFFGLIDVDRNNYFSLRCNSSTRGHSYKLLTDFSQRVAKVWNSMPSSIVKFHSVSGFKASMERLNLKIFTRN